MAGLRPTILTHLANGSQGSKPARRIRPETEAAILGVQVSGRVRPSSGMVDATGTHRRIQALVALGWTRTQLAERLGVQATNLDAMLGKPRVRAATEAATSALYSEMWDKLPPEDTPLQVKWARRSRDDAAAKGWPPPLAWDDRQLDRPAGRPVRSWVRAHARAAATADADSGTSAEVIAFPGPESRPGGEEPEPDASETDLDIEAG
jgi:hypothetical protein